MSLKWIELSIHIPMEVNRDVTMSSQSTKMKEAIFWARTAVNIALMWY